MARELGNSYGQVENGETIGVENENGDRAVMVPADDELIPLYTDHEEGSEGLSTMVKAVYNGVTWVQIPAVLPWGLSNLVNTANS